jgi:hypothetical protein
MNALNQFIIRISKSGWLYVFVFAGFFGTLQALLRIGQRFPELAAGAVPFDLQNRLTVEQIFAQLAGYTEEAFELYYIFTAIDYFFPLFAGLFLGATAAFLLRHSLPRWYSIAEQKNLFVLFLLATLFDWLENIAVLSVIAGYPNELSTIATLAVAAKMGKLAFVFLFQGFTLLLLIFCAGQWLVRKAGLVKD